MEHLNSCRQAVKFFSKHLEKQMVRPESIALYRQVLEDLSGSQKFLLPDGGRLHDDKKFKLLDETQPLRLPFPSIAIEYTPLITDEEIASKPDGVRIVRMTKTIILAKEVEDGVSLTPICCTKAKRS